MDSDLSEFSEKIWESKQKVKEFSFEFSKIRNIDELRVDNYERGKKLKQLLLSLRINGVLEETKENMNLNIVILEKENEGLVA